MFWGQQNGFGAASSGNNGSSFQMNMGGPNNQNKSNNQSQGFGMNMFGMNINVEVGIQPGQEYVLKSMSDPTKVLDCSQSSNMKDHNDLIVWDYNGGDNQKWIFKVIGNHYILNCKKNGGSAALVQPGSDDVSVTKPNNGSINEQWKLIPSGIGEGGPIYVIENAANHRVLDINGGNATNGAKVNTYTNNSQPNQKWLCVFVRDMTK